MLRTTVHSLQCSINDMIIYCRVTFIGVVISCSPLMTIFILKHFKHIEPTEALNHFEGWIKICMPIIHLLPYMIYNTSILFLLENPFKNYPLFIAYASFGVVFHFFIKQMYSLYCDPQKLLR